MSALDLTHNGVVTPARREEMKMKTRKLVASTSVCAVAMLGLLTGFPSSEAKGEQVAAGDKSFPATQGEYKLKIPFGLEETAVVIPADNPLTKEKIELGRLLFFDKRLSKNNTIACASCHMA